VGVRLKSLFLAGMSLFPRLGILAALAVGAQGWRQVEAVNEATAAIAVLKSALSVSERLALERGGHNEALLKETPASPAVLASLESLRSQTDDAFHRTLDAVDRAHYQEAARQYTEFERVWENLKALRTQALRRQSPPDRERVL